MKKHVQLSVLLFALCFIVIACVPITSETTLEETTTASLVDISSTTEPSISTFTLSQLQHDYDQLVGYFSRNPKLFTNTEELDATIITQRELLFEGMTALQLYRVIAVVVASIRCGHTMVQAPYDQVEDFFYSDYTYPVEVRLFDTHLRVTKVVGITSMETGDEIVSIDGTLVTELTQNMERFLSADGQGTTRKNIALCNSYLSYYLLFIADDDTLDIEYFDVTQKETVSETINRSTLLPFSFESNPPYESHFEDDYAILTVREFSPYDSYTIQSFLAFFETFFTTVKNESINYVILDIRDNSGGDPRITSNLFSYLAKTSQPYFRSDAPNYYTGLKSSIALAEAHYNGNLYTLINGSCFSSCGHFAALLKYQQVGIFIGEETNGSYVCSDSSTTYTLTNSRLSFRTSTTIWPAAVEGMVLGRGVMPDIQISTNLDDYVLGIDTVMMVAIEQIEQALANE
ncbi:MAG: S41 family peptidase [Candidatus Izemoplasmatales bacterium]